VKDLAAVEASIPEGTVDLTYRARLVVHYLRARRFPVRMLLGNLLRRVSKKVEAIRAHVPRTPVGAAPPPPTEDRRPEARRAPRPVGDRRRGGAPTCYPPHAARGHERPRGPPRGRALPASPRCPGPVLRCGPATATRGRRRRCACRRSCSRCATRSRATSTCPTAASSPTPGPRATPRAAARASSRVSQRVSRRSARSSSKPSGPCCRAPTGRASWRSRGRSRCGSRRSTRPRAGGSRSSRTAWTSSTSCP
jgi:hypothetical protein